MSDVAKWALLIACFVGIVAALIALPIFNIWDDIPIAQAVSNIVSTISPYLHEARGLINFFYPAGTENVVTALLVFNISGWLAIPAIKLVSIVYHFIFK